MTIDLNHTFGQHLDGKDECLLCPGPHGGAGKCDHIRASRKRRRFDLVPLHLEETLNALLNPDRAAASAVKERQDEEFAGLPGGHICSCVCPNIPQGRASCDECRMIHRNEVPHVTVEIGRGSPVVAPSPDAATLDLLLGIL